MVEIKDTEAFGRVVARSLAAIDGKTSINSVEKLRWINAVAKAALRIESSGHFMTWNADDESLLIWSDSNEIYELGAVDAHVCMASMNGKPCWHRCAKRLVSLYMAELDAEAKAARKRMDKAPYIKNTGAEPTPIGSVRI